MANRYFVGAGNWGDTGHWSLTDNGSTGQTVPSSSDDVFFTANSGDCVLDSSARVCKSLTVNGFTGSLTFDQQLSVSGSITFTTTGFTFAGAATNRLRMIAAGTWTTNGMTVAQNVEIGGTTTFTCTLAGHLTTSGDLFLTNTTSTIFSGNYLITAASATISGSQTLTLTNAANFQINGLTTSADNNVINGAGKEWRTWGLTTTGTITGTAKVVFNGTGTWTGAVGSLQNSCDINTAGTLTLSGNCKYLSGTLTYVAGTIDGSGSLYISGTPSPTIVGGTWPNLLASGVTINGLITVSGTITLPNGDCTFAGSAGWICGTLANTAATSLWTWTLTAGNTYRITSAFSLAGGSVSSLCTLTSSHASNKVAVTVDPGATINAIRVHLTRIDATGGQPIVSFGGTITTCFNCANSVKDGNAVVALSGSLTITGVTYDKDGSILGSCDVYLLRDNGAAGDNTFIAKTTSDASTGAYSFTGLYPGSNYFVAAFLDGATDVFDVTGRDLVAA